MRGALGSELHHAVVDRAVAKRDEVPNVTLHGGEGERQPRFTRDERGRERGYVSRAPHSRCIRCQGSLRPRDDAPPRVVLCLCGKTFSSHYSCSSPLLAAKHSLATSARVTECAAIIRTASSCVSPRNMWPEAVVDQTAAPSRRSFNAIFAGTCRAIRASTTRASPPPRCTAPKTKRRVSAVSVGRWSATNAMVRVAAFQGPTQKRSAATDPCEPVPPAAWTGTGAPRTAKIGSRVRAASSLSLQSVEDQPLASRSMRALRAMSRSPRLTIHVSASRARALSMGRRSFRVRAAR
jgi:hypothetical protein